MYLQGVCVVRIYSDAGEDWQVALQFGVLRSWQTKFGLLLERQVLLHVQEVMLHSNVIYKNDQDSLNRQYVSKISCKMFWIPDMENYRITCQSILNLN